MRRDYCCNCCFYKECKLRKGKFCANANSPFFRKKRYALDGCEKFALGKVFNGPFLRPEKKGHGLPQGYDEDLC